MRYSIREGQHGSFVLLIISTIFCTWFITNFWICKLWVKVQILDFSGFNKVEIFSRFGRVFIQCDIITIIISILLKLVISGQDITISLWKNGFKPKNVGWIDLNLCFNISNVKYWIKWSHCTLYNYTAPLWPIFLTPLTSLCTSNEFV